MPQKRSTPIERLLIVLPTWLGDCVMAMPTVRALRELYPAAHLTVLVGRGLKPIVTPTPWADRVLSAFGSPMALARRLRRGRFDAAVLLPNSFRWAMIARLAGIPQRIGYARDGRGWLLTDALLPRRAGWGFVKVPTRDYYLNLARYLGADRPDPAMRLYTRCADDAAADELLARAGYRPNDPRPLVLLNPGARYGDAKMWHPERFAAVADRAVRQWGAVTAVTGAPSERAILDRVIAGAETKPLDLPAWGLNLRLLKSVVRRAAIMFTNDTGPRHVAAAMGTPVVTIFGPTDPKWTEIGFARERQVMLDVECGPCQLKRCPLDHRCMNGIDAEMVFKRAAALWPTTGQGIAGAAGEQPGTAGDG